MKGRYQDIRISGHQEVGIRPPGYQVIRRWASGHQDIRLGAQSSLIP